MLSGASGFASDLPACPSSGKFDNCFGTYTAGNGDKYVGEFKNGTYDGQGTYTFSPNSEWQGSKYVGEFKNGKYDGQGTFTYSDGDKYLGEYKDNEKHGYGVYYHLKNNEFKGDMWFGTHKGGERISGLYVNRSHGSAKIYKKYIVGDTFDHSVHNVVPVLKQTFNSLDKDKRQVIQHILKEEGIYYSTIDGLWGRNTLNAIAEFAVLRMKTIDFNGKDTAQKVLTAIQETAASDFPKSFHLSNDIKNILNYSLLIEESGDTFMYTSQLSDGKRFGDIVVHSGYKWFGNTFNDNASPQIYIQPAHVGKRGDFASYTNDSYEIGYFRYQFEENAKNDQFLHFDSNEAINRINSYIAKDEPFTFAGLSKGSWYAGKYFPVSDKDQLVTLARNNPNSFCFLLDLPITSKVINRELKINNLAYLMQDEGISCDNYNNVVFEDKNSSEIFASNVHNSDKTEIISELPACPATGIFNNCFGSYTFEDGDKYLGEWKDDELNGKGTLTATNGDKYIGEWRDGSMHGEGAYTFANGDKYVGEYKNHKRNGQGTETFVEGIKFVGEYRDDKRHGMFTVTYANGDKFVGEYKDDKKNGQGTYTFANGDKYLGEWKDGFPSGQGTETFSNGNIYVGKFKDGERNGQGTETLVEGIKFIGEYRDNKRHGMFTVTYPNGDKYLGEYKDDKKNGQGTYTFADGDKYQGAWKDGNENGLGIYNFGPNSEWAGDIFIGEYKDGKENGQGFYIFSNGKADFCTYTSGKASNCSGTNVHNVAPVLKATFNSIAKDYRKAIQQILKEDGKYNSTIDGLWSRNTFVGIAEFAVQVMKTIEFNRRDLVEEIFVEIVQAGLGEDMEPTQNNNNSIVNNIDPNEILNAASGTGFYVSNEGHIITNHHVIDGCSEVKAHAEGKSMTATILAEDASNDLALLKISQKPPHVFAFSKENPYPLQNIIVAGFPFGDAVSSSLKFTTGVVSSLAGIGNNYSQMQIDAAIQPGNSGGPIIDELGNIVGVAVAKLDVDKVYEDFGVIPENTNFGIKGSIAKILLQSFNIPLKAPNTKEIPKSELSKITSKGTLHLSCWMTAAQIEAMQSQKAMFENFD